MLEDTKQILADNLKELLNRHPELSRLELARKMCVADGSLGRIKYGTGNPQLNILCQIADFFRVKPWQLLVPGGVRLPKDLCTTSSQAAVIPPNHIRILVHEDFLSGAAGRGDSESTVMLSYVDVTDGWAKERLGTSRGDSLRIVPILGDSMSPTINDGDLVFVDISVNRFVAEGMYLLDWHGHLHVKRIIIDPVADCLEIRSDNSTHPGRSLQKSKISNLDIRGRVKTWLVAKGY